MDDMGGWIGLSGAEVATRTAEKSVKAGCVQRVSMKS